MLFRSLSVADNHRIPSEGTWTGVVDVAGAKVMQSFEVFNSNGAFEVILGKLWLKSVQATHHYMTDEITMTIEGRTMTLTNETTDCTEVQADKGPEPTQTVTDEGMAQRMAGRNAGTATAEGEVTQRAHMSQKAEPHVTAGKGHKTSHHDP